MTKKKLGIFLIKLVFTCALLGWIISRADLGQMREVISGCRVRWLVLALCLHCIGLMSSAVRWRELLLVHGIDIPVWMLGRSYLVGMFFNFFLPGSIGGDVVRAYDVKKEQHSGTVSASVVLFERVVGVSTLLVIGAVVLGFQTAVSVPDSVYVVFACLLSGLLCAFVPILFVRPETTHKILKTLRAPAFVCDKISVLHGTFRHYRGHKTTVVKAVLLSVVLQVNVIFYYFCISKALGFGVDMSYFFVIVPVAVITVMIPVTINGIGLSENIWAFLLANAGVSVGQAVLFSWTHLSLMLCFGIVGGVAYLLRK